MRKWVLSFLFQLRFLFAGRPEIICRVLCIVYRVITAHLVMKAGHTHQADKTGVVTRIRRFGSALNLNINFQMLFFDGGTLAGRRASPLPLSKVSTRREFADQAYAISHR